MKSNHSSMLKKASGLIFAAAILVFSSCTDGYKDDWEFTSDVRDSQLESPDPSKITVTTVTNATGGQDLKITWPVIHGAGGYQFSFYNVDDPDNPIVIGTENEIIDGCTAIRDRADDTRYKIVIKTLGNTELNNTGATAATEAAYTTFIASVATIPSGSDLADYFTQNPIQGKDSIELVYELEPGGNYTLNSLLDFGTKWITLRGDKVNRPYVTYGEEGRLSITAGFKLRFIDFDCSAVPASSSNGAFLLLSATPNPAILETQNSNHYAIHTDVMIESCNIKGINRHLLYDSRVKYCLENFRIQDCIISINSTERIINTNAGGGYINGLTLTRNTFYGLVNSSSYLIQYGSSGRPDRGGYLRGNISLYNNTFYNIVNNGQIGNYSGMNSALVDLNMTKNLFVNCGAKYVVRRISGGGTNMVRNLQYNCYWYDGGFASGEEMGHNQGDNATANKAPATGFYDETSFTGPIDDMDPSNVNFTPTGSQIISNGVGDPRWLPAQ